MTDTWRVKRYNDNNNNNTARYFRPVFSPQRVCCHRTCDPTGILSRILAPESKSSGLSTVQRCLHMNE